jgi:hypothetical protein
MPGFLIKPGNGRGMSSFFAVFIRLSYRQDGGARHIETKKAPAFSEIGKDPIHLFLRRLER